MGVGGRCQGRVGGQHKGAKKSGWGPGSPSPTPGVHGQRFRHTRHTAGYIIGVQSFQRVV